MKYQLIYNSCRNFQLDWNFRYVFSHTKLLYQLKLFCTLRMLPRLQFHLSHSLFHIRHNKKEGINYVNEISDNHKNKEKLNKYVAIVKDNTRSVSTVFWIRSKAQKTQSEYDPI